MANIIKEIVEDVAFRLGTPTGKPYNPPMILRAMNRVYKRYNRKYMPIEAETVFTFSQADIDAEIIYKDLPADWIRAFRISPKLNYRDNNVFVKEEEYTYTIHRKRFYVGAVAANDSYTVDYYSSGGKLVNKETPATGEVNTPEWDEDFHQILLYATCLELSPQYAYADDDRQALRELRSSFFNHISNKQATDMHQTGPPARTITTDIYENDY